MSYTSKVIKEENKLKQYEFESYLLYLQKEYSNEFIDTDDKIADRMNFEFGTVISGTDVKKFKDNYFMEKEDMKLIYRNCL